MATQHQRLAEHEDEPPAYPPAAAPAAAPTAAPSSPPRADESSEPTPQVAVLPSGEMVYLSKDNPYARSYAEHTGVEHDPSNGDPYAVPVPPALLATYQQVWQRAHARRTAPRARSAPSRVLPHAAPRSRSSSSAWGVSCGYSPCSTSSSR